MDLPPPAFRVITRVVRALEAAGFRAMLVGGLATFAWGEPRTTRDMHVAVLLGDGDLARVRRALQPLGADLHGPYETDFGPRFILPFKEGLPVDVFLSGPASTGEFDRAREVRVEGERFLVKCPEDVVLSKLRNATRFPEERFQDLRDASGILFKQWAAFDFPGARGRCKDLGVCEALRALEDEVREARLRAGLGAEAQG